MSTIKTLNQTIITLTLLLFTCIAINAQSILTKGDTASNDPQLLINGMAGMTTQYNIVNTSDTSRAAGSQPEFLNRLYVNTTIKYGELIIPVNLLVSFPQSKSSASYYPYDDSDNFGKILGYITNPVNRVGAKVIYKEFMGSLGTHTPQFSELTTGNIPVFGAGFKWTGDKMFAETSYGFSQVAIDRDTINNIAGQYQRDQKAFRFGLGKEDFGYWAVNYVNGQDYLSSVSTELGNPAQKSFVVSTDSKINFSDNFSALVEFCGNGVTEDVTSTQVTSEDGNPIPSNFYTIRYSTHMDIAGKSEFKYQVKNFRLAAKALYVGAGYKTFGNPFFQSDRMELSVSPGFTAMKGRMNFQGSVGNRTNNLSATRSDKMNQLLAFSNLNVSITNSLNINLNYSNFGMKTDAINDTLRIQNVNQSLSFTPVYSFESEKFRNTATLMLTASIFEDFNTVTGVLNDNNSMNAGAAYLMNSKEYPMSLNFGVNYFDLKSSFLTFTTKQANTGINYRFLEGRLKTGITGGYLINSTVGAEDANQVIVRLNVSYRTPADITFAISAGNNNYTYGVGNGQHYQESNIKLNVYKQF